MPLALLKQQERMQLKSLLLGLRCVQKGGTLAILHRVADKNGVHRIIQTDLQQPERPHQQTKREANRELESVASDGAAQSEI